MNRLKLVRALELLQPVLTNGGLLDIAGLIVIGDNQIVAIGEDMMAKVKFPIRLKRCVLPGKEFIDIISKLSTDDITITKAKNSKQEAIIVKGGKTVAEFNVIDLAQGYPFPEVNIPDENWVDLPSDFGKALEFCSFSMSNDPAIGILQSVHTDGFTMYSCDDYRGTAYKMDSKLPSITIPKKVIGFLSKNHVAKVCVTESSNIFYKDKQETIFSHRIIDEEYPDITSFFDIKGTAIEMPKEISDMLSRADILADDAVDGKSTIRISIRDGEIVIIGESVKGKVTDPVKTDYKGIDMDFYVPPQHLSRILKETNKVIIGESQLLFTEAKFQHVISLIKEEE